MHAVSRISRRGPSDLRGVTHKGLTRPLSRLSMYVSRKCGVCSLVLAVAIATVPHASALASSTVCAELDIASADVDAFESGSLEIMIVAGRDRTGALVAREFLTYDPSSGSVTFSGDYFLDGHWANVYIDAGDEQAFRYTGSIPQEEFRIVHTEFQYDVMVADSDNQLNGPVGCALGVTGATGACGGLAGIPFAGWFACGMAVAGAACICFDKELNC